MGSIWTNKLSEAPEAFINIFPSVNLIISSLYILLIRALIGVDVSHKLLDNYTSLSIPDTKLGICKYLGK